MEVQDLTLVHLSYGAAGGGGANAVGQVKWLLVLLEEMVVLVQLLQYQVRR
jgi:hypothetical protein